MFGKIFKLLGIAFAILISVIVTFVLFNIYYEDKNSRESEQFARESMTAIARNWAIKEILDRYNPRIKERLAIDALENNLRSMEKVGTLKSVDNFDGNLLLVKSFQGDPDSTAIYKGELNLEKGVYVIRLLLSKWDDKWFIDRIDLCDKLVPGSVENCRL